MKVRHIIVCGHYGCGGVRAAMDRQEFGLIDNWLRKIKDVYSANKDAVDSETDPEKRLNLLDAGNLVLVVTTKAHHALFHHPMPLPDDLVIEFIDATAAALSTLETLNRHDLLGFVEVLVMAKDAPNVCPLPHRYRDPESDYEARLCNAAERAQDRLAEQLNGFVRRFTALRNDVLRAGMAPVVRTLSVQGAVADTLHLTPAGSSHCQELALPAKFARIFRHLRHALTADTALVSRLADAARRQSLEPMDIQVFHAYADPHRAARFAPGRYRTHDIDWSSEYPSDVPAAEVPAAHDAFYAAFDQALLTRWHPVIRAGLGLYECLRISAHVEERRRIADLVCTMLMDEMGLAFAPIMLALHRHRHGLDNLLDGTLRMGSPDLLLDHMVTVAEDAIVAGRLMLERLRPEYQRLLAALVAGGFEPEAANFMVVDLLSNVMVRVPQPGDVVSPGSRRMDRMGVHLHALGMIDRVDFDSRDWWSSPVVRKVASSWP